MNNPISLLPEYLLALFRNRNMPRAELQKLQEKLWRKKALSLEKFPAFADIYASGLGDFDIIPVDIFRAKTSDFNCYGFDYETAYRLGLAAETGKAQTNNAINIGLSSGTSGTNRGVFITNPRERTKYIANILAKAFSPIELLKIKKIALCLRANNPLYERVNNGRINLKYFPLEGDKQKIANEIKEYSPDVLIAPTQIILKIARMELKLPNLAHLFYGAEAMNKFEAKYIQDQMGMVARPIYQATEGFLGIGCKHGTLHINEDSIIVEREYIDEKRFVPIITDLHRQSQAIIRLKLDDIWQETKCNCKSNLLAIEPIEGRVGDIWRIEGKKIFPSEIIDAIGDKIEPWHSWQIMASQSKIEYAAQTDSVADTIVEYLSQFNVKHKRIPFSPSLEFPKMRHIGWRD